MLAHSLFTCNHTIKQYNVLLAPLLATPLATQCWRCDWSTAVTWPVGHAPCHPVTAQGDTHLAVIGSKSHSKWCWVSKDVQTQQKWADSAKMCCVSTTCWVSKKRWLWLTIYAVTANLLRLQKCAKSALIQHILLSHHQGLFLTPLSQHCVSKKFDEWSLTQQLTSTTVYACIRAHQTTSVILDNTRQGWARDVNGRDRDEMFKFRDDTETRRLQVSRRDRNVEMHVVFNAVLVNVGLTTVATVTACPLVLGCIPDFCVFNSNDCVQTFFMPLQPVGTGIWKNELYHSLLLKVVMLHKYWDGCARAPPTLVVKTTFLSEQWRTAVT